MDYVRFRTPKIVLSVYIPTTTAAIRKNRRKEFNSHCSGKNAVETNCSPPLSSNVFIVERYPRRSGGTPLRRHRPMNGNPNQRPHDGCGECNSYHGTYTHTRVGTRSRSCRGRGSLQRGFGGVARTTCPRGHRIEARAEESACRSVAAMEHHGGPSGKVRTLPQIEVRRVRGQNVPTNV
jgi:hypothetical protein